MKRYRSARFKRLCPGILHWLAEGYTYSLSWCQGEATVFYIRNVATARPLFLGRYPSRELAEQAAVKHHNENSTSQGGIA